MHKYTDDTYDSIWLIENLDGKNYRIVRNSHNDEYSVFLDVEIDEVAYTCFAVIKEYTRLNGKFLFNDYYFEVKNNFIHSTTSIAICCPCGLEIYRPYTDVSYYMLDGKILTRDKWIEKIRDTETWPEAMAHILSPHLASGLSNN
jgi:hypothetical protein